MQQIARYLTLAFSHLQRPHYSMLKSLIIFTLAAAIWRPYIYSTAVKWRYRHLTPLEDHQLYEHISKDNKFFNKKTVSNNKEIFKNKLDKNIEEVIHKYIISTGDTLSNILIQNGVDISDIHALYQQNPELCNLKIGQSISWKLTSTGDLKCLVWDVSCHEKRTYNRLGSNFLKKHITNINSEWCSITLNGKLNSNFINSARMAGLTNSDINIIIKTLKWQLDFSKLRKGDQFSVLISKEVFNNKSTHNQLLAIHLKTEGKDYYAFRADNGKFYNLDAASLSIDFMRFPTVKQFRVSSDFNLHRLNPVTGRITPHRGVDFAMPVGTPVLAVGDGEVIISKKEGAAGNYIAILHDHQYMTRYMHLKKLLVKQGQKVRRGDSIALSGNTGRSTGPHLHYEVWINQQAVDPLIAKLPSNKGLTGIDRTEYLAQVKQMLPKLQLN